jgi:hypothetical protein
MPAAPTNTPKLEECFFEQLKSSQNETVDSASPSDLILFQERSQPDGCLDASNKSLSRI